MGRVSEGYDGNTSIKAQQGLQDRRHFSPQCTSAEQWAPWDRSWPCTWVAQWMPEASVCEARWSSSGRLETPDLHADSSTLPPLLAQ